MWEEPFDKIALGLGSDQPGRLRGSQDHGPLVGYSIHSKVDSTAPSLTVPLLSHGLDEKLTASAQALKRMAVFRPQKTRKTANQIDCQSRMNVRSTERRILHIFGSPESRDLKRCSQSSTQSSGLTPSSGSPVPKKTGRVVRRSFSNDQYGGFSQHVNHLPTIPAPDASSVLSTPASARRKSTSTLGSVSASYEKGSPPKNGSSGTRSNIKHALPTTPLNLRV